MPVSPDQRFPTEGSRTPGGPTCDFREWEFADSWIYIFSKESRFMKGCKCYYSKQHYLAKHSSYSFSFRLLNACIAVSAIVSALWRWNVYDAIVARLLIMLEKSKVSGVPQCKVTKNWLGYKSPFYCSALCSNIFMQRVYISLYLI